MSITAAIGIPKFEAGPQKSTCTGISSDTRIPPRKFEVAGEVGGLTGRAKIAQHWLGTYFGIDGRNCGCHYEGIGISLMVSV